MTEFVAAIDGGGSKVRGALLGRDGTLHLTPDAPGSNPFDNPDWRNGLGATIEALNAFSVPLVHLCYGAPGFGEAPTLDADVRTYVAERSAVATTILNDVEMAYHAAFTSGYGVMVLAGTGSMVFAGAGGALVRAGGWGDRFGDEGSAHWIGREALGTATRELDGRLPPSGFARDLQRELGAGDNPEPFFLMQWYAAQPHPRSAIARVARAVDALADTGNEIAHSLLVSAAGELAEQAEAAARGAGLPSTFPWCGQGSVFQSQTLSAALASRLAGDRCAPDLPPLGGGLVIAARAAGWAPDARFVANLNQTLTLQNG